MASLQSRAPSGTRSHLRQLRHTCAATTRSSAREFLSFSLFVVCVCFVSIAVCTHTTTVDVRWSHAAFEAESYRCLRLHELRCLLYAHVWRALNSRVDVCGCSCVDIQSVEMHLRTSTLQNPPADSHSRSLSCSVCLATSQPVRLHDQDAHRFLSNHNGVSKLPHPGQHTHLERAATITVCLSKKFAFKPRPLPHLPLLSIQVSHVTVCVACAAGTRTGRLAREMRLRRLICSFGRTPLVESLPSLLGWRSAFGFCSSSSSHARTQSESVLAGATTRCLQVAR